MMINLILMDWFQSLIKRIESEELRVRTAPDQEGFHDCLRFEIETSEILKLDGMTFYPSFLMFYRPSPEAVEQERLTGELAFGDCSTGVFDCLCSMTSEGYAEGLYLAEDHHPDLFKKICSLAKMVEN